MIKHFLFSYILIYSMEQSPSWEVNWFSARQKIPCILWNPKVLTAFTTLSHLPLFQATSIQPMLPHSNSWISILTLSWYLGLGRLSRLLPSHFPTKNLYAHLISPICAKCPAYHILLDMITIIISDKEYRSLSTSLCSFLHPVLPRPS